MVRGGEAVPVRPDPAAPRGGGGGPARPWCAPSWYRQGHPGAPGVTDDGQVARTGHALGAFLRARRQAVRPEQVGYPVDGRRRVPGLRREEVAVLAGLSVDYYVRLEQGRAARPSAPVLHALAAALLLDETQRQHLRQLAVVPEEDGTRASTHGDGAVRPGLQALLDAMPTAPAFVLGRRTELLACNALGAALHGDPMRHPRADRAMARLLFLDAATRALYPDWHLVARDTVGALRRDAGRHPADPLLTDLVDELSRADRDFRT